MGCAKVKSKGGTQNVYLLPTPCNTTESVSFAHVCQFSFGTVRICNQTCFSENPALQVYMPKLYS